MLGPDWATRSTDARQPAFVGHINDTVPDSPVVALALIRGTMRPPARGELRD